MHYLSHYYGPQLFISLLTPHDDLLYTSIIMHVSMKCPTPSLLGQGGD